MSDNEKAIEVLKRLDELGAINLDVMMNENEKVSSALRGLGFDDWENEICYKHYIRLFRRQDLITDQITTLGDVAQAVKQLGVPVRG